MTLESFLCEAEAAKVQRTPWTGTGSELQHKLSQRWSATEGGGVRVSIEMDVSSSAVEAASQATSQVTVATAEGAGEAVP